MQSPASHAPAPLLDVALPDYPTEISAENAESALADAKLMISETD